MLLRIRTRAALSIQLVVAELASAIAPRASAIASYNSGKGAPG